MGITYPGAVAAAVDIEDAPWHIESLEARGTIWVAYGDDLSRLPVTCGRCQARTACVSGSAPRRAASASSVPRVTVLWIPAVPLTESRRRSLSIGPACPKTSISAADAGVLGAFLRVSTTWVARQTVLLREVGGVPRGR
jgi:hypothetical protein